jgi:hypothetical protein
MKKLILVFVLAWCSTSLKAQYCGPFTPHAPITATTGMVINGYKIDGGSSPAITIPNGAHDITIVLGDYKSNHIHGAVDFQGNNYNITFMYNNVHDSKRGLYVVNGTNGIKIKYNNISEITDPTLSTDGSGAGNAVQFKGVSGYGNEISYNKIYHASDADGIGDQISLINSFGRDTSWIKIYNNDILHGSTNSLGFTGINICDGTGGYQDVQNNRVVQTGVAGISLTVGTGSHFRIINNDVYSPRTGRSNEGIAIKKNKTEVACSGNRVNWKRATDGAQFSYYLENPQPTPDGWSTNLDDRAGTHANASLLTAPLWPSCTLPPVFSYFVSSTSLTYGVGMGSLVPANTGGAPTGYSISPALPAGLSFSTATGVISGTPTTVHSATTYTVTATNVSGSATASVNITINPFQLYLQANSFSRGVGAANPTLTYKILEPGFVNGDTQAGFTTPPVLSTAALIGSPATSYAITISGAVYPNYNINYIGGILIVSGNTFVTKRFAVTPTN